MDDITYELDVNITIRRANKNGGWNGDQFTVTESAKLPVATFLEVAEVLGKFHALTQTIRKEVT